ncbi:protein tyrosine phosphatase [Acinetobacter sp. Ac_877]|uniref:dual specificity protein phosphatase family protein n=1 Tax=Acinetobacter portensis TaxID=1839785 RepID=UPI00128E0242|nr:dual specificity protein phosphatase family protein [Acinetobacter portensis]MPW41513.1 protein tyrosine phosphatase [Acinetobacter portensis]
MKKITFTFLIFSSLIFTGCVESPTLPIESRPSHWGKSINSNHNFYEMSSFVYRSEQPVSSLIPDLKKHKIDVVINLRSRDKDSEILKNQKLKLIHIPVNTWAMNRDDLLEVMKTIQSAQASNQKVLIHCYHGSDRTGASIAMYRIIFENWTTEDALNEMKYGGYGFHPIWINIEKIFSPENIRWIRQQVSNPS